MKPLPIPPELEDVCSKLREAGSRITRSRLAILLELVRRGHPTPIDEIHSALRNHKCDLVTVYRCLWAFENLGLVQRTYLYNGTTVWGIADDQAPSYHVTCRETGTITPIEPGLTQELHESAERVRAALEKTGFRAVTQNIQFFGVGDGGGNAAPRN